MNKPEILKGEVKEFIGIVNLLLINTATTYLTLKQLKRYLYEIESFYSQPFKPEMITEYFEGWIKQEDWLYSEGAFENDKQIIVSQVKIGTMLRIDGYNYMVFTLSQFITNCTQAGIKLTWKRTIGG